MLCYGLGEIVRKANTCIRRHGQRDTVSEQNRLGNRRKQCARCDDAWPVG